MYSDSNDLFISIHFLTEYVSIEMELFFMIFIIANEKTKIIMTLFGQTIVISREPMTKTSDAHYKVNSKFRSEQIGQGWHDLNWNIFSYIEHLSNLVIKFLV